MSKTPSKTAETANAQRASNPRQSVAWLIIVPLLLFVVIACFAPNFVNSSPEEVRRDPLGGDFLQEYAGGVLYRDKAQNNQLYNVDVCREIQHDTSLLGFAWDESRFFPMVYPPFYYAVISPISKLDYTTAMRLWLLAMVAFLAIALLWLKRSLNVHHWLLLSACVAAPLLLSLTTGQKSSLLFLILTGTFCLMRADKPFLAGAFFGLIAFKPHLGIPIGLFMLIHRQWSFVIGCYITVGCLIVASLATGFDICTDFFGVTMGFTNYVHNGGYHLEQGFSLWSAWQLALSDREMAKILTIVTTLIVLAGTAFALRKKESLQGDQLLTSMSIMTIATVLVAPHLYAYDLAMLLLPLILLGHQLIQRFQTAPSQSPGQYLPVAALAIVLLGMSPLIWLASFTGINFGVVLMFAAWASIVFGGRHCSPQHAMYSPRAASISS